MNSTEHFVNERLAILETKSEERWESHDKKAQENKEDLARGLNELKSQVKEIDDKVTQISIDMHKFPCVETQQNISKLWGLFWCLLILIMGLAFKTFAN